MILEHVISEGIVLLLLVGTLSILQVARRQGRNLYQKNLLEAKTANVLEDLTLTYNKRNQYIDTYRVVAVLVAILLSFLVYDIQAFSFFILGLGAIVVVMKESVSSLIAYVYILATYDIGDDIRVGDTLGEIGKIRPLYTSIIGKEESGEHNGRLIYIPNYVFLQQKVEMQELKATNYRRNFILYTLHPEHAHVSYETLVTALRAFLDDLLPVRSADEIGHFRSYAGRRYRLSLDYNIDGFPTMRITFVARADEIGSLRENIITFLENKRNGKK